jgi:hypothetical protein
MRARTWLQEHGVVAMLRRGARQGRRGVASLLAVAHPPRPETLASIRAMLARR